MGEVIELQAWKDEHHPSEPFFDALYAEEEDGSFRLATPEEVGEIEQAVAEGKIVFEDGWDET